MRQVIPGTTPSIGVKVRSDLTGMLVYLTFEHRGGPVTKSGEDLTIEHGTDRYGDYTVVSATLTQAETLGFPEKGTVKVQVRACNADGSTAYATEAGRFQVGEVLLDGEIPL